ncbi:MAG: DegT/DnrJ/EryC1/StrS family aminotransferase [Anaerolineaceae bacterium]|nr:DegT/DnrJ/EryC1/StrS family aminotransferase [Anaerolineaceae bacterium]
MKVMANDLQRQFELYAGEFEEKALTVLRRGWYILGEEVSSFEREFAEWTGAKYCVGLGSGLDALWISFRLLDIGPGDEVIVSSNAYIACVMGITMNGARPVFVESDRYYNMDASEIEKAVTPRTKAILAVHLFGQACDMTEIMHVAEKYGLQVVEDCAQAHGNHWQGKTVGTFGRVGCFSFYPTKGCGAFGDAGAVITDDEELARKFRVFRNYGSEKKYYNSVVGTNSRLDELQAGLLRVRLSHMDELNCERMRLADRYFAEVHNPLITLPEVRPGADCVWHQFVIRTPKRNELIDFLKKREIGSIIHYPIPPYLSEAYGYLGIPRGSFPYTELAADEVLSLPIYNGMTDEEQSHVIKALNAFRGQAE